MKDRQQVPPPTSLDEMAKHDEFKQSKQCDYLLHIDRCVGFDIDLACLPMHGVLSLDNKELCELRLP